MLPGQTISRKAHTLKDIVAPNLFDRPLKVRMFGNLTGFYLCWRCNVSRNSNTICTTTFTLHVPSKQFAIQDFVTCHTKGVVFLPCCSCGLQYVRRTTRALGVHIGEHLANIRKGFRGHSLFKHILPVSWQGSFLFAGYSIGIEKYTAYWQGSDLRRQVSCRETFKIFDLRTLCPWDLNVE